MTRRLLLAGTALMCALLAPVIGVLSPVAAQQFVVTRFDDPAPGACAATDCSLREAIEEANNQPGRDEILLREGTYLLNGSDNLEITDTLTIRGQGQGKTIIDAQNVQEAIVLAFGAGADVTVTIIGLTVRDAREAGIMNDSGGTLILDDIEIHDVVTSSIGGGIHNDTNGSLSVRNCYVHDVTVGNIGGGISNNSGGTLNIDFCLVTHVTTGNISGAVHNNSGGTLNLSNSVVTDNLKTIVQDPSDNIGAGGVYNNSGGTLNITNTEVSNNTATVDISGGGVANNSGGTINILNSTISGNRSTSPEDTTAGGIYSNSSGTINIRFTTITNNSGGEANSIRINSNGTVNLSNAIIVTDAAGGNCTSDEDGFVSAGFNISNDASCSLTQSTDQPATNPNLGPLANNSGFSRTHAITRESPAFNAASSDCPDTDQRLVERPQLGGCDIGAFEFALPAPTESNQRDVPNIGGALAGLFGPPPPAFASPVPTTVASTSPVIRPPNTGDGGLH